MLHKILLTSFTTWLPHQLSNSSDDLLHEISKLDTSSLAFLRLLPVDVELASCYVIAKINELQPSVVICCGMAESRTLLSIESTATCGEMALTTPVNLPQLVTDLVAIEISNDAGHFVCESLYYSVLKYIIDYKLNINCIFVHVPILTEENLAVILKTFKLIIEKIKFIN